MSQENHNHDTYRRAILDVFNKNRIATLFPYFSACNEETEHGARLRAKELEHAVLWARKNPETANLPLGCFADGPGVAAALMAAAQNPGMAQAIVARGGKPDRVLEYLPRIKIPVLLIACGRDPGCLRSSQKALEKLNGDSSLNVMPHASQSFQEPGATEESAQLAALWFLQYLG
jgi:putative phosphoribosyl transferase